jgi:hypothetical protein
MDIGGGNSERRDDIFRALKIATRELKDVYIVDSLTSSDLHISISFIEVQEKPKDPIVFAITVLVLDPADGTKLLGATTSVGYWNNYKGTVRSVINYLDDTPFQDLREKQRQKRQLR